MSIRGEIFSSQVQTEKRTYFFNVKENRTGSHFLNLVESTKKPDGSFERHSIMVYEEDIEKFMRELNRAFKVFKRQRPENSSDE